MTVKAVSFTDNLTAESQILDLDCGTGGQTMVMAQYVLVTVTGMDLFPQFINLFNANAAKLNLQDRVKGIAGLMDDLPFGNEAFDLIWSEGAIYNIGFERGLNEWMRAEAGKDTTGSVRTGIIKVESNGPVATITVTQQAGLESGNNYELQLYSKNRNVPVKGLAADGEAYVKIRVKKLTNNVPEAKYLDFELKNTSGEMGLLMCEHTFHSQLKNAYRIIHYSSFIIHYKTY
jgi:SAM-dependent methyltransferase